MKILYISQYYPPEIGAPAARVSELSREWAARGHQVTVLTAFPHHPHGTKRPEDRGVLTRRDKDGDIDVVRTYVFAARNQGFLLRILSYVSFMFSAILIGTLRVGKPDVVIATSPQLFTAVAGWWVSLFKRAPFVFEVRDLWPESIVTVGAMREGIAIRCLKRVASWLYRSCDRIVTVGAGYKRGILEKYPVSPDKFDVITNGVDVEQFTFREQDRAQLRTQHGWQNKKVVLYLGTHGMAHGLDFVLGAAEQMRDREDIQFALVGDGAEKENLIAMAKAKNLTNVSFISQQPKNMVVSYYAASDICLVPLRKVDLFKDVLPSKIFEIMAMNRPILISVDGDARAEVERAHAGIFVEPENIDQLVRGIALLADNEATRQLMGDAGRKFVVENYQRGVLAERYLDVLSNLLPAEPDRKPANTVAPSREATALPR